MFDIQFKKNNDFIAFGVIDAPFYIIEDSFQAMFHPKIHLKQCFFSKRNVFEGNVLSAQKLIKFHTSSYSTIQSQVAGVIHFVL